LEQGVDERDARVQKFQELVEQTLHIPLQLSDLKYQIENHLIDEKIYFTAMKALADLKKETKLIMQNLNDSSYIDDPDIGVLAETQVSLLSQGIAEGIQHVKEALEDASKNIELSSLSEDDFYVVEEEEGKEPKVVQPKETSWLRRTYEIGHKFIDNAVIRGVPFELTNDTRDIMNGLRIYTDPQAITSHGKTEVGPACFCVDVERLRSFIFNGKAYIYGTPEGKAKFPAQLISDLKSQFGLIGAERIMRVCNQASTAQPLMESQLIFEEEFLKKHPEEIDYVIKGSTGMDISVRTFENCTEIVIQCLMTTNFRSKIDDPKNKENLKGEKEPDFADSEPPDNSWGEYFVFKKIITIPNEELMGIQASYPNLHVEDQISITIDTDQQAALDLLERF
jgi:hypothetical protein